MSALSQTAVTGMQNVPAMGPMPLHGPTPGQCSLAALVYCDRCSHSLAVLRLYTGGTRHREPLQRTTGEE